MTQGKLTKSSAAHEKDARWARDGLQPYFAYRDLGIKDATEGKVLTHIIRAVLLFSPVRRPNGLPLPCFGLPDGLADQGLGAEVL